MKKQIITLCALTLFSIVAIAQSGSKKVDYFSAQDIQKQLADLAPKAQSSGSSGSTLGDYTSHQVKLSVRTVSGGAEVHAHYDDVLMVTQGHATLITGGTVDNPKTGDDGETQGTGIHDGSTQLISTGDVVHIPAGTPHQLKIAKGTLFSTIVVKVRE
jgi:mannose-6-phosphate isomerase-like protein (cupin superfamily)